MQECLGYTPLPSGYVFRNTRFLCNGLERFYDLYNKRRTKQPAPWEDAMKLSELLGKALIAFAGAYGLLFVIAFLADLYMSEVRGDNFAARGPASPLDGFPKPRRHSGAGETF